MRKVTIESCKGLGQGYVYTQLEVIVVIPVLNHSHTISALVTDKFWHFSSYHHSKAWRASDFIPGLWAHWAFCFTNPTFEAVGTCSFLSEAVAVKPEV